MKNFDTFGVMIDCSRGAVPNVEGLKRFFRFLSGMGYNMAMLYTEDTYEIEGEPYFGYKRGRYTEAELQELDDCAFSLGIELIPCIQTLAHLGSIFRWEPYQKMRDTGDILLAEDEKTYTFIEKMFQTVKRCFRSRRIHVGMDEAHAIGLGKYLELHGFENRFEILSRHLDRVCDMAKAYGYEPLMWEDMYFKFVREGGDYRSNYVLDFPEEVRQRVPKNVTMVYWDYYANSEEYYNNMIKSSYNLSDKVWFAGGAWTWLGIAPHNRLSIWRNGMAIPACIKNGVRNAFFTAWGDNGGECPYFAILPTLMHAAATADGLSEAEMKEKFRAVTGENYDAMIELDLPNHVFGEDIMVERANYSKSRLYEDPFLGIYSKSGEKVDSNIFASYAKRLHDGAKKSPNFSLIFKTMATLCDVLLLKYDLAERTRTIYASGDKAALRRLADEDYTEILARIERFYEVYRAGWFAVNKPQGFEVEDIRLGGLMQRMKTCRSRLLDYCEGKADAIPELAEEVLPISDPTAYSWSSIVSANGIG